jgi:hypothetical protein
LTRLGASESVPPYPWPTQNPPSRTPASPPGACCATRR